jgi:hypothetical protein
MNDPHHASPENLSPRISTPRVPVSDASRAPRITLHIEELVVHGAVAGDRSRIGDAVQAELHRLIAAHGMPPWFQVEGELSRLDAPKLATTPQGEAASFGGEIARAVFHAQQDKQDRIARPQDPSSRVSLR